VLHRDSPCAENRDVFYFDIEGSGVGYVAGQALTTNLDANWQVTLQPDLYVQLSGGVDYGLSLDSNSSMPSTPGTYPESSANGPWLEIDDDGVACGVTGGTLTIDDLSYTNGDAGVAVTSVLLFFDGQCSPDFTIHGCLRYASP
jgi:hypothetical protein